MDFKLDLRRARLLTLRPSSVTNQDQTVLDQNTERICYVYFAVTVSLTIPLAD